jgi:hypothetical protein
MKMGFLYIQNLAIELPNESELLCCPEAHSPERVSMRSFHIPCKSGQNDCFMTVKDTGRTLVSE